MGDDFLALLVENFPQQRFAEAIFQDKIESKAIRVFKFFTLGTTLGAAESSLLSHPDRPVAVLLETQSQDVQIIRDLDETAKNRLIRVSPARERWHVALAIPRLDAWALTDDHIRQEYDKIRQDPASATDEKGREAIERNNYLNLAARMSSFVQDRPFDLENLKRKSRQCRELCEFIERSFEPVTVPTTTADWF